MEKVCDSCTEVPIFARGRAIVSVMQLPHCYYDVAFRGNFYIIIFVFSDGIGNSGFDEA
jgi:hypothetical protein